MWFCPPSGRLPGCRLAKELSRVSANFMSARGPRHKRSASLGRGAAAYEYNYLSPMYGSTSKVAFRREWTIECRLIFFN
eukprot:scaffold296618_cov28-Tisochrysis_lutea.AAC.2